MSDTERRDNYPIPEKELYGIKDIDDFIEKERRHDELDRIREVRVQKRTWKHIFIACAFMNLVFIALAILGGFIIGK